MTERWNDAQLGWVVRNRRRKQRVAPLSDAASRVVDRVCDEDCAAHALADVVASVVDDGFRSSARVRGVQGGALLIEVVDRRLIASIRLEWGFAIMEALRAHPSGRGVRSLRFVARESTPNNRVNGSHKG